MLLKRLLLKMTVKIVYQGNSVTRLDYLLLLELVMLATIVRKIHNFRLQRLMLVLMDLDQWVITVLKEPQSQLNVLQELTIH